MSYARPRWWKYTVTHAHSLTLIPPSTWNVAESSLFLNNELTLLLSFVTAGNVRQAERGGNSKSSSFYSIQDVFFLQRADVMACSAFLWRMWCSVGTLKTTVISGSCSGGPIARSVLSCGFFNVLLNCFNGQFGLCEGTINISCQGMKTMFLLFSSLILALAWKAEWLWEVWVTQCCHLLMTVGTRECWHCMQSLDLTAGGRVWSATREGEAACDLLG